MSDLDPLEQRIIRLADRLDGEAESRNYHDFVGTHRALAGLLSKHLDTAETLKIMRALARLGGLDRLKPESLGMPDCWQDWVLPRARRMVRKS